MWMSTLGLFLFLISPEGLYSAHVSQSSCTFVPQSKTCALQIHSRWSIQRGNFFYNAGALTYTIKPEKDEYFALFKATTLPKGENDTITSPTMIAGKYCLKYKVTALSPHTKMDVLIYTTSGEKVITSISNPTRNWTMHSIPFSSSADFKMIFRPNANGTVTHSGHRLPPRVIIGLDDVQTNKITTDSGLCSAPVQQSSCTFVPQSKPCTLQLHSRWSIHKGSYLYSVNRNFNFTIRQEKDEYFALFKATTFAQGENDTITSQTMIAGKYCLRYKVTALSSSTQMDVLIYTTSGEKVITSISKPSKNWTMDAKPFSSSADFKMIFRPNTNGTVTHSGHYSPPRVVIGLDDVQTYKITTDDECIISASTTSPAMETTPGQTTTHKKTTTPQPTTTSTTLKPTATPKPTTTPQPTTTSTTPQPITTSTTPQSITTSTTPQPTTTSTTPQPTTTSTTPQPTTTSTTPQPITTSTTPQPTITSTTPQPTITSTTPQPTITSTTPQPITTSTTPQPITTSTTPQPTTTSTTPQPTTTSTTPQPTITSTTPQQTITSTTPQPTITSTTPQPTTTSTTRKQTAISTTHTPTITNTPTTTTKPTTTPQQTTISTTPKPTTTSKTPTPKTTHKLTTPKQTQKPTTTQTTSSTAFKPALTHKPTEILITTHKPSITQAPTSTHILTKNSTTMKSTNSKHKSTDRQTTTETPTSDTKVTQISASTLTPNITETPQKRKTTMHTKTSTHNSTTTTKTSMQSPSSTHKATQKATNKQTPASTQNMTQAPERIPTTQTRTDTPHQSTNKTRTSPKSNTTPQPDTTPEKSETTESTQFNPKTTSNPAKTKRPRSPSKPNNTDEPTATQLPTTTDLPIQVSTEARMENHTISAEMSKVTEISTKQTKKSLVISSTLKPMTTITVLSGENSQQKAPSKTSVIVGSVSGCFGAIVLVLVGVYFYMRYRGRKISHTTTNLDNDIQATFDQSVKRNSNDVTMQQLNGLNNPEYAAMDMQPISDPASRFSTRSFDNKL